MKSKYPEGVNIIETVVNAQASIVTSNEVANKSKWNKVWIQAELKAFS